MRAVPLIALSMLTASPAAAEVLNAGDHGFEVQNSVNLVVPQEQAYANFGQIGQWWNKEHTYSGDSKRMSLQMRPGGCFCEPLDNGGGIEHMRVTFVQPGERVLLTGSLGPLLYEATTGVMDVKFERIAGGARVTMNYRAAGFAKGIAYECRAARARPAAATANHARAFRRRRDTVHRHKRDAQSVGHRLRPIRRRLRCHNRDGTQREKDNRGAEESNWPGARQRTTAKLACQTGATSTRCGHLDLAGAGWRSAKRRRAL